MRNFLCAFCTLVLISSAIWTISNPLPEGNRLMDKKTNGSSKELDGSPQGSLTDWKFYTPGQSRVVPHGQSEVMTNEELEMAESEGRNAAKLWEAFRRDDTGLVKLLINTGVDANLSDSEDMTILHHAAEKGRVAMTELLLDCGSDVNARDLSGSTPLMLAARSGEVETARILLEHGADPNIEAEENRLNGEKSTAMKTAVQFNRPEIVQLLKNHGAYR